MMQMETSLVVPILDTLSSLELSPHILGQVMETVLSMLASTMNLDHLPMIVKFLIHSTNAQNIDAVVAELRDKLQVNFFAFNPTVNAGASTALAFQTKKADVEALILEALVQGMNVKENLVHSFFRAIDDGCQESQNHRILDLWVLFGAESINRCQVRIEKILKKKVTNGLFSEKLLVQSIQHHGNALSSYFNPLLSLAGLFVRSSGQSRSLKRFGSLMYELMFDEFKDPGFRQEIIGSLIMHSGSSVSDEVDCALDTLVALVASMPSYSSPSSSNPRAENTSENSKPDMMNDRAMALKPQLPFLHQLLDYVAGWTYPQIRQVYRIICTVVCQGDRSGQDQINTVINKQLSHSDVHYRYLGIIGKIMMLELEMKHSLFEEDVEKPPHNDMTMENSEEEEDEVSLLNVEIVQHMKDGLADLTRACGKVTACQAFLLDEFTHAIQSCKFSSTIVTVIADQFSGDLESTFLEDYDPSPETQQQYVKPIFGAVARTIIWKNLDGQVRVVS